MSGAKGQRYERLFESDEEAPPHEQVCYLVPRDVTWCCDDVTWCCDDVTWCCDDDVLGHIRWGAWR